MVSGILVDMAVTFNVEASTLPNREGTRFKRAFRVSGDQLTCTPTTHHRAAMAHLVFGSRKSYMARNNYAISAVYIELFTQEETP